MIDPNYNEVRFITTFDSLTSNTVYVEAYAFDDYDGGTLPPSLEAGQFVSIFDIEQDLQWFGQVVEPQRNISRSQAKDSPSMQAALQRLSQGTLGRTVVTNHAYHYQIRLIGQIDGGRLMSITKRPRAASLGYLANEADIHRFMNFPHVVIQENKNNIIGVMSSYGIKIGIDNTFANYAAKS